MCINKIENPTIQLPQPFWVGDEAIGDAMLFFLTYLSEGRPRQAGLRQKVMGLRRLGIKMLMEDKNHGGRRHGILFGSLFEKIQDDFVVEFDCGEKRLWQQSAAGAPSRFIAPCSRTLALAALLCTTASLDWNLTLPFAIVRNQQAMPAAGAGRPQV